MKQILVVEDNSIVAKDIQKRLTSMGYSVPHVVASGDRALTTAEQAKPDLVLMDIMLKGSLNGMETAQEMTAKLDIPVVYLTAYSDDSTLDKAKTTGAFGYLLKPFNETELHTTIELALYKHQMERRLRESEQWLATTINSIDDIVLTTDTNGKIISLNRSAENVLGILRQQAIGARVDDFITLLDENGRRLQPSQQTVAGMQSTLRLKARDGQLITVENRSTQLRDAEGNILGAVLVLQDVSERKKAEEEIQRLNRELHNKVNELTTVNKEMSAFNYSVSHDLRGPLIAIDGFVRVLSDETSSDLRAESRKYLSVIKKNTRAMLQTIDDLLLFTRLSRSELEKTDLDMKSEMESVFDELRSTFAPRHIEFVVGELPHAFGDHAMLRQVIINLLSNAIKFTRYTESARIEVGGTADEMSCLYFVRDNGAGFSMTDVHRLFEVFQRLHSSSLYEGSGVGLAIAHRIIERHGGKMWAESSANNGATFYFTLPRANG